MPTLGKPHIRPTVARIDLAALQRNFQRLRSSLPDQVGILAAVKGNAYGHGAARCALALQSSGCGWFGVALVEEGRALREAGVRGRILVLSGSGMGGVDVIFDRQLTPVLFEVETARRLDAKARLRGEVLAVHLKVDTGMGRLGVAVRDWEAFCTAVAALPGLRVEGLLSHYAVADEDPTFTAHQRAAFAQAIDTARSVGLQPTVCHLANSAGMGAPLGSAFDLVRPGLHLYGVAADGAGQELGLEPVMRISSRVLALRQLEPGDSVSYGRTWVAPRRTTIAWLPVGYADGYLRALSNGADVLIGGQRAPVRGRVCMDLTAVDVTDIPGVQVGDEVVLLGPQGHDLITANELAVLAGTIPYEILTSFSERVPRRYLVTP